MAIPLGDEIYIPYAVGVEGQIIKIFDRVNHDVVEDELVEFPIPLPTSVKSCHKCVQQRVFSVGPFILI